MPNPFLRLKQKLFPSYLGVDIGTTSVKMVEVKPGKELPNIVNYGILESSGHLVLENQALQTSSLKLFDREVVELLKLLIAQVQPKTKRVLASLPTFSAFTTVIEVPEMSKDEFARAMVYQARQYVPLPLADAVLDWQKVGEYRDEKGFRHDYVLLISVPRDTIKRYQDIFTSAGLELATLEIEALSLVRALVAHDPTPTMIVDIGSRSTTIAFAERGMLAYTVQTDYAGASITHGISRTLNINPVRAEEMKREHGITVTSEERELSTLMLPFLDVILGEVKRAHASYQGRFPTVAGIQRVILAGGGGNLPGLDRYAAQELALPVVKAAPFFKFTYPPALEPLTTQLGPELSVALGLVLREFQ